MPSIELKPVVEKLQEQESNILEILTELEEQVAEYKSDLKRIQDALAALQQTPKQSKKQKSRRSKPSASKSDVESALAQAATENPNGELAPDDLRKVAEQKLIEQGFSRSGLGLRFKQVLKEPVGQP